MAKFELIDHTADVGVAAYGDSLEELFENAAMGMFSVIADAEKVSAAETRTVEVMAEGRESLLVAWEALALKWQRRHPPPTGCPLALHPPEPARTDRVASDDPTRRRRAGAPWRPPRVQHL